MKLTALVLLALAAFAAEPAKAPAKTAYKIPEITLLRIKNLALEQRNVKLETDQFMQQFEFFRQNSAKFNELQKQSAEAQTAVCKDAKIEPAKCNIDVEKGVVTEIVPGTPTPFTAEAKK